MRVQRPGPTEQGQLEKEVDETALNKPHRQPVLLAAHQKDHPLGQLCLRAEQNGGRSLLQSCDHEAFATFLT
eukprot:CAMPEP_0183575258 /NCGR_PEP_ID=MMETSP0371-20130417/135229_1 /TAXON_ID=268820 /ORGANISM="Peridinium aciculiferum, Strain PAER-2" /LENGTH=71 /DNA_ID=CAMNT_0025785403 /DNA_START=21 /DNA_END=236 /DNA_ORIENTATION=+